MTSPINVSRAFLRDFAELANFFEWTPDDIAEIKRVTRLNPALVDYWSKLAQAHRDGYRQDANNNWMRLDSWMTLWQKSKCKK